nr:hypothetical protein [Tanacetum cinerariifolium]
SSDPTPECQTMVLEYDSLSPGRKCQENVSHGDKTDTMSNELDLLFSLMFDELLNGSSKVVSKSSAISFRCYICQNGGVTRSAFNVAEDTLNRFKVRGFGSLLEAGTKVDTKYDIGPTFVRFFSTTLIASSSSKSSSTKGDVLEGGGVSSNVTLSDSLTFLVCLLRMM